MDRGFRSVGKEVIYSCKGLVETMESIDKHSRHGIKYSIAEDKIHTLTGNYFSA